MIPDLPDFPKRPRHWDFERREFTLEQMRFLGSQTTFQTLGFKDCPIGDAHIRELAPLLRLSRLWLEGTQLTDAALETLAALPKLEFLILDRTQITGEGLRHFAAHTALKTLWACETRVDDSTIGLAARIPKLSILRIARTNVSFEGLLSLAHNAGLKVAADGQFSPEQITEFEALQRRRKRESRGASNAESDGIEPATTVLLAFFEEMNAWERYMVGLPMESGGMQQGSQAQERCAAIFQKYCTDKPRLYGRPNALSFSSPPQYSHEEIMEAEQPTLQKVVVYTKDSSGMQHRYWLVKSRGEWRVDHRESQLDGWSRDYL